MRVTEEHFESLLRHQIDGTASDGQLRELEAALLESQERIREYVALHDTETLLEWELGFAEVSLSLPDMRRHEEIEAIRVPARWKLLAAAAGIAMAFLVGIKVGPRLQSVNEELAAAVLFDSEDAIWKEPTEVRHFGAPFQKGKTYELESGIARLAFATGAGLAIEGPGRMKVVSANRVEILEGRIAAYVPEEAAGFVVTSPGMEIIDLGTKFGAEIKPGGRTEVHVFEGQVEVQGEGQSGRRLIEAGEALRYESGEATPIAAREEGFAEPPSLEQLLSIGMDAQERNTPRRRDPLKVLRTNKDLLVFEDFRVAPGEIDSRLGALGFGKQGWKASRLHTQVIRKPENLEGGRLLIRGRQVSEPNVVNRISNKMAAELPKDFFVAITGRYDGIDDNDFFAVWVDSIDGQDSSHSVAPNLGIREGQFFGRIGLEDTATGFPAIDGEEFTIVLEVKRQLDTKIATVRLWCSDAEGELGHSPVSEVAAPCDWMAKSFRYLGLRMGKDSDVTDKVIVDRLSVGTTLDAVLSKP